MKTVFLGFFVFFYLHSQAQTSAANYQLLPENLAYFTAARNGKAISLAWQTVNEQHSKGFKVQRRTTGDWETIGFISTRSVDGNSSVKVSYDYADANPFRGVTQYRVIETTADGKERRSEIRAVKGESQANKAVLYPNPSVNGRLNLAFENTLVKDVLITDQSGRLMKQLAGVTTAIVIENLLPGYYSINIINRGNNESQVLKAVVTR